MRFWIPKQARIFDVVDAKMSSLSQGRWKIGKEIGHAFPHEQVAEVGARIGEAAWMGFVDTTGMFNNEYGRPLR